MSTFFFWKYFEKYWVNILKFSECEIQKLQEALLVKAYKNEYIHLTCKNVYLENVNFDNIKTKYLIFFKDAH